MFRINKRLVPIKAHYFFFMAAMGPILPQLGVLGKQIGIAPEVMGYITFILPVLYVLAKPLFGFIADYFVHFRKGVFLCLIAVMTLSYAAFYFVPSSNAVSSFVALDEVWNVTVDVDAMPTCRADLFTKPAMCSSMLRKAVCSHNSTTFSLIFADPSAPALITLNLSNNFEKSPLSLHTCLEEASLSSSTVPELNLTGTFNGSCSFEADIQSSCFYSSAAFWLFTIFMCVGTIGFNVTNSISDAICFDMLGEAEESKYGAQRVWGTIGFGLTAFIAGIVVDVWTVDEVKSFTPALLIMLIFGFCDIFSVCTLKLPKLSSSETIVTDVWELVRHPAIAIFMIFATIAGIFDSLITYYMFWHLEDVAAETGFMHQIKLIEGCVVAAECLAGEIPFFFYSGKIIKKLGYIHCMSMCFFFYAVRLAFISWIPNPWYLVGVEFFLQGCTYALCYTCIVAYASAVAPPGTSATVQGLMAGMDDGLGFSIGSLVGGLVFKNFGGRRCFLSFSVFAICTCIAHIIIRPSSRKRQYLPKTGYKVPKEQAMVAITDEVQ